jgi:hypothetical protein
MWGKREVVFEQAVQKNPPIPISLLAIPLNRANAVS